MGFIKRVLELPKTSKLRKDAIKFINNENVSIIQDFEVYKGYYEYTGKSKKITSKKVEVLEDTGLRCKIRDSENNVTKVTKKMLKEWKQ